MTTQSYLGQVVRFERMTQNKLAEIERYRGMATSTTVANKEDKIQTSSDKDKLGSMVAKIIDLENEITHMETTRACIIDQIEGIANNDMYTVLYDRFITNRRLEDIRQDIHCSKSQVYRIFASAMYEFEEKYGKTYLKS